MNDDSSTDTEDDNKTEEYEKDLERDVDVTNVVTESGTKQTDDVMNDDEEDEGIIMFRRSERLKRRRDEFSDFLIYDVVEKRKSMKKRQKEAKSHSLAAPFVLDEASVSFRAPSGYYGSFGQRDLKYTDQRDFSSSPPQHKFKKNDIITDDDNDDYNGGYELGDETLQKNIGQNIAFLEEDDLNLMILNLMILNYQHLENKLLKYQRRQERVKGKDEEKPEEEEEEIKLNDNQKNKVTNIMKRNEIGVQPKMENEIGVCLGWYRQADV